MLTFAKTFSFGSGCTFRLRTQIDRGVRHHPRFVSSRAVGMICFLRMFGAPVRQTANSAMRYGCTPHYSRLFSAGKRCVVRIPETCSSAGALARRLGGCECEVFTALFADPYCSPPREKRTIGNTIPPAVSAQSEIEGWKRAWRDEVK